MGPSAAAAGGAGTAAGSVAETALLTLSEGLALWGVPGLLLLLLTLTRAMLSWLWAKPPICSLSSRFCTAAAAAVIENIQSGGKAGLAACCVVHSHLLAGLLSRQGEQYAQQGFAPCLLLWC